MQNSQRSQAGAPRARQVIAAIIGNALEWYDFIVYGFLTVVISKLFFPTDSEYGSLLLTTATFGVGFFMRPVGGILIGMYADRKGRKAALQLIIGLMTVSIAMIAFAPTYAAIGIGGPLIIVLARMLQGFATGGEFASSTAFLVESAPSDRRGLYGSWQMFGQGLAVLGGALVGALVTKGLSPEAVEAWGWRIPFLGGLLIGPVGLWIRRHLEETEAFIETQKDAKSQQTLRSVFSEHRRGVLVSMCLTVCATVSFYVVLVYMPTFANRQLHLPLDAAFLAQVIGVSCLTLMVPLFGAASDRIGRKPILAGSMALYLVLLYPLFHWVNANPGLSNLIVMQVMLCSLLGAFFGPFSSALAEQFPPGVRSTGMAVAYNIAVMVFGGFAQLIVTWLIHTTGSPIAPVFYVIFGAVLGLLGNVFLIDPVLAPHSAASTGANMKQPSI
ncbi:MFS transporter [Trinickia terrae]|uniref:MFS transporter n=1 Tax=Trinickia terrae TaxID=2571161 RepID=A0A4U1I0U1_9BURK|nr:citrate-proton symporter [Trinickia terrae]TKC86747.1 MFS transporter [Trinickia terrae]